MNSRGYQKTSSRNIPTYNDPHHRPDNYYETARNYNTSRQFHTGIFTSELNKRGKKEAELALEIEEVPDYTNSKARTSSKRSGFGRESRDQYYRQSELNFENIQPSKQELLALKNQIYQNVSEMMKEQGVRYDKTLLELVSQINTALKKSEENYGVVKRETVHLQEEFGKLGAHLQLFSKENEEKLETLVNEVAALSGSKKKAYGDYGVDLKNSFQGLNSSISVNLGNEPSNSKLVNEVIYQLDTLKKELSENKLQIEEMSLKLNSNIREPSTQANSSKTDLVSKEDLIATIDKRIRQERKTWKLDEKIQNFESKLTALYDVLHKHEENIFSINEEMASTFNNQMNPKFKKIEGSIVDIYSKIDPLVFENQLGEGINRQLQLRLKDTHLLKVRSCTKAESSRISSITGMNEERLTSRETYLLDEQNYLLDSEGSYLMEQCGGVRRRVRLQEGQLYLLGLKGIEIAGCS